MNRHVNKKGTRVASTDPKKWRIEKLKCKGFGGATMHHRKEGGNILLYV